MEEVVICDDKGEYERAEVWRPGALAERGENHSGVMSVPIGRHCSSNIRGVACR